MLKDKLVRIRFRREFAEQPTWVFFGRVRYFSESWVGVDGRGMFIFRRQAIPRNHTAVRNLQIEKETIVPGDSAPVDIETEDRFLIFPREHIANIRVLPDTFDLENIRVAVSGQHIHVLVDGAPNTSVDELTED